MASATSKKNSCVSPHSLCKKAIALVSNCAGVLNSTRSLNGNGTRRTAVMVATLWVNVLLGQRLTPPASFVLNVDYARFHHDSRSGYLELYYGFYPRLITFEASEGKYRGGIKLSSRLTENKSGVSLIQENVMLPLVISDSSEASFGRTFVSQAGYFIPLGEYTLTVVAVDSLDSNRRDSVSFPVQIASPESSTTVSDLELCSELKSSKDESSPFYKNSLEVVPNPKLVFGVTTAPVIFYYVEFYNLFPDSTYVVKTSVVDNSEKVVRETSKSLKYGFRNTVEAGMTNVSSIMSGRYKFSLALMNGAGKQVARSSHTFYAYNPHVQGTAQASGMLKSDALDGLSAEELADEFRKAQYLVSDQEIKAFSQVTSTSGRKEILAKLWAEAAGGRLGHIPIDRTEYLRRVSVAKERYHSMAREGWKTDRGRILILYGEPDAIERHPNDAESKPYEIWNYYSLENGVIFIFADRTGFGEYVLVHSTKRGELRDETWQRYLR